MPEREKLYAYNYDKEQGEHPIERLRNKISSFTMLVSILCGKKRTENTESLIHKTNEELENINLILTDIENDLNSRCNEDN